MTTLAYRDGVLAADRLITSNGTRVGLKTKIWNIAGFLVGATGTAALCNDFEEWVRAGCKHRCPPMAMSIGGENYDCTGIVFIGQMAVSFVPCGAQKSSAPFHAFGSGCDIARGAMWNGATPEEAVRAAMEFDIATGGEVDVLRV